jgi:hypothetical protein
MSEVTEQQLEDMEALFVQTAASMTSDRGTITLQGLSPSTLYFADRPQREVGHILSRSFVANWAEGDNSFADNPPNAVLSFAEPGDRLAGTKQDLANRGVSSSPRRGSGGFTWRSHRPFGACEAAPGPLGSLASASAEAYPAWVWPAHPVRCFAWSMPPRHRAHQQEVDITLGGVAGSPVRAASPEWARTVADAARVLGGRTGGPGCHGG